MTHWCQNYYDDFKFRWFWVQNFIFKIGSLANSRHKLPIITE